MSRLNRFVSPTLLALLGLVAILTGCGGTDETPGVSRPDHPLAWTLGSWEGVRRDGASGDEEPMTLEVRSILGGVGTLHELRIGQPSEPYLGFSVQVPAREVGLWVRQYTNATGGEFTRLEGQATGSGCTWRVIGSARGRLSRLESLRDEEGIWTRTMRVSEDGGASWRVLWTDRLEPI